MAFVFLCTIEPFKLLGFVPADKNEFEVRRDMNTVITIKSQYFVCIAAGASGISHHGRAERTFGSNTAIDQASLSCVTRIKTMQRMSMIEECLCNSAIWAIEYKF